jgi:hypothetical protein
LISSSSTPPLPAITTGPHLRIAIEPEHQLAAADDLARNQQAAEPKMRQLPRHAVVVRPELLGRREVEHDRADIGLVGELGGHRLEHDRITDAARRFDRSLARRDQRFLGGGDAIGPQHRLGFDLVERDRLMRRLRAQPRDHLALLRRR